LTCGDVDDRGDVGQVRPEVIMELLRNRRGWGSVVRSALVIGGTGLIGRAVARRLLWAGWQVTVTGRDPRRMPADLAAAGVRLMLVIATMPRDWRQP
jgi:phosphoglycerate dehydrogenase-like enzyme